MPFFITNFTKNLIFCYPEHFDDPGNQHDHSMDQPDLICNFTRHSDLHDDLPDSSDNMNDFPENQADLINNNTYHLDPPYEHSNHTDNHSNHPEA